jgi:hypothetical protein
VSPPHARRWYRLAASQARADDRPALSVDLITAEGELVKASQTENSELFGGLRGGGGNFGIVTEFEFRLHPVGPAVLAGPMYWPAKETLALLRFYREWIAEAPDELTTILMQRGAPAVDFVPTELHGEPIVAVVCCYAGAIEDGEEALRPITTFGSPVLDLCQPKPYLAHQTTFDAAFPHGWHYYFRACDVAALSEAVIDVMVEYGDRIVSPITSAALWQMGERSRAWTSWRPPSTDAMPPSPSTSTATARPPKGSRPSASGRVPTRPPSSPTTQAFTSTS